MRAIFYKIDAGGTSLKNHEDDAADIAEGQASTTGGRRM
jgi:hypothetical protein